MEIQIPQPCHEKWNDMTPTKKGVFCLACQHEVIDFTEYSDAALRKFFTAQQGKICGKFRDDQLNHILANDTPTRRMPFAKIWLSIVLITSFATRNEAKENTKLVISTLPAMQDNSEILQGCIVNEANERLAYASIRLKNSTLGTSTDENGVFRLAIPKSGRQGTIALEVSLLGYDTQLFEVMPHQAIENLVFTLRIASLELREVQFTGYKAYERTDITGGVIAIASQEESKPKNDKKTKIKKKKRLNLWQKFKNIFRKKKKQ